MKNLIRYMAVLLCILLLIVPLLSGEFVIHYENHDCSGHDCDVCIQLDAAVHIIRNLEASQLTVLSAAALVLLFLFICSGTERNTRRNDTLITLKVELLN